MIYMIQSDNEQRFICKLLRRYRSEQTLSPFILKPTMYFMGWRQLRFLRINVITHFHRKWTSHSKRTRSEEHTSELQSRFDLVCRLLLEKKKKTSKTQYI